MADVKPCQPLFEEIFKVFFETSEIKIAEVPVRRNLKAHAFCILPPTNELKFHVCDWHREF